MSDEHVATKSSKLTEKEVYSLLTRKKRATPIDIANLCKEVIALRYNSDECTELSNEFNMLVWEEKLNMKDQVFLPQDFGFPETVKHDGNVKYTVYTLKGYTMWLLPGEGRELWALLHHTDRHIDTIRIRNAYDAKMFFDISGIEYTLE